MSLGYDNNFWRVSEVVSGATGSQAASFGYDADGLVVCVSPTTCPGSGALSFERHSGNGMVTSATSGLLTETHSVSAYGEPARHVVADGTTTLYDLTLDSTLFPRDALGRIVRKTEVVLGTTRASDYTYDALGRLTDVVVNDIATEHYEYDPNGNRLRGVVTKNGVTTDWTGTYDAQDRLLSYGPLSFTYTANGELLTKTHGTTGDVTGYTYDAFGNLRSVELPDGRLVEYLVDGQNRRVAKRIDGVTTKQWLWSSQLRIAGELDASGTLTKRFIYGEKVNVPELMVDVVSGAVYRIVTDQLGSPVLVVNVANTSDVLLRAEYDAFGNRTVLSGDGDAVPFGFAGGLYDEDTGLVRFGARDYEPVVGRWVTKDPIRWEGGQGNFYGYVGNDPVNQRDPIGLQYAGTTDCSYYTARCYQNGGSYYCEAAPYWCDFFGTNPWANCTRACLQTCDSSRNPRTDNYSPNYDHDEGLCPSLAPEEPDNSEPWNMLDPSTDMTQCHVICYAACWGVTVTGGP